MSFAPTASAPLQSPAPNPLWLGRCAAWGMPAAFVLFFAFGAFGVKLPAIVTKVFVGGCAIWGLQSFLKANPQHVYALAARKLVRLQLGLMLGVELLSLGLIFLVAPDAVPVAAGLVALGSFVLHLGVAIWGSRRLRAVAKETGAR